MNIELMCEDISRRSKAIYSEIYFNMQNSQEKPVSKKELSFEIVDNDEINGRAWCTEKDDYININKGVISHFINYFKEVNDYYVKKVIQQILPEKEESDIEKMSIEGIVHEGKEAIIFDSKALVEERTNLLEIFVARFILVHEMGHLFNGHCEYLKKKEKNFKFISMYNCKSTEKELALNRRTLEMDADAFAATQSFRHLLYLFFDFKTQVKCTLLKPIDLFYWWSFAIRSHFLSCEDYFADSNKYTDKMDHLPSNARWYMITEIIMQLAEMLNPTLFDIKEVQTLIMNGAIEAENIFNIIKYTNYNFQSQLNNNPKFDFYKKEVNDNWDKIVKELTVFARCPLYEK